MSTKTRFEKEAKGNSEMAYFSRVINLLLTKLARDRTGRISALGLFCTSRLRADILPVRPSRLVNKIYIHVYKDLCGVKQILLLLNEHEELSFLYQNLSSHNISNQ